MKTVTISKFKSECLGMLDPVELAKEDIIITNRGKPVAIVKSLQSFPKKIKPKVIYKKKGWEFKTFESEWE